MAHRRQAFHWELAHQLCEQYDGIVLETLNLHGMQALWGRKVSDLGFGTFVQRLHHVAQKTGTIVHHIDSWFPSSKLCHVCNASINIYREGASSLREGHVRLAPASNGC